MTTCNHLGMGKVTNFPTRYIKKRPLQIIRPWLVTVVILLLPHEDLQQTNFFKFSRSFSQEKQFLDEVKDFELRYRPDEAIQWYTKSSSVLSEMVNTICRTQNPLLISKIRYYLHNIHEQLAQLYLKNLDQMPKSIVIYHAQRLSSKDFRRLSRSRGKTVFTTTLLSASISHDLSDLFPGSSNSSNETSQNEITVLFNIAIQTQTASFRPFAYIPQGSDIKDEGKVLLSIGMVFTCVDVCQKVGVFKNIDT